MVYLMSCTYLLYKMCTLDKHSNKVVSDRW